MKKLILIPLVAAVVAFGSPFASVALAKEKPAEAAVVCTCPDHNGASCIDTKGGHICIHEKNPTHDCEHEM